VPPNVVADYNTIHGNMGRIENMEGPESGTLQTQSFHSYVGTLGNQHQPGTGTVVVHNPAKPLALVITSHRPVFIPEGIPLSINQSGSCNGHVILTEHVDQCRRPLHLDTGHTGKNHFIILQVLTAQKRDPLVHLQGNVRQYKKRPGAILARLKRHHSSTPRITGINR